MMSQVPGPVSEQRRLGAVGERLWRGAALAGVIAIGVSLGIAAATPDGWRRFFFAYLLAFAYVLSLALGSLYFVLLHHLTNSGWSVVVRRIAEVFAGTLPFLAVLGLPLLFGLGELYPWARAGYAGAPRQGRLPQRAVLRRAVGRVLRRLGRARPLLPAALARRRTSPATPRSR